MTCTELNRNNYYNVWRLFSFLAVYFSAKCIFFLNKNTNILILTYDQTQYLCKVHFLYFFMNLHFSIIKMQLYFVFNKGEEERERCPEPKNN